MLLEELPPSFLAEGGGGGGGGGGGCLTMVTRGCLLLVIMRWSWISTCSPFTNSVSTPSGQTSHGMMAVVMKKVMMRNQNNNRQTNTHIEDI